MTRTLFINLPVRDLAKAKALYLAIGAVSNPQFSDATSACMTLTDSISVMLMTHEKWKTFTAKPIADARQHSEVMLAISCADRTAVDTMNESAARHGGRADVNAKQDLGFLYNRSFEDADGHIWEAVHFDASKLPKSQ